MKKILLTAAAAACLGLALSAGAAGGGMTKEMVTQMDEDKDGTITKEEYMKHSKDMAMWKKMDKNKDDKLDPTELGFQEK